MKDFRRDGVARNSRTIWSFALAWIVLTAFADGVRSDTIVYDNLANRQGNFIPLQDDGTLGRPVPGDHMGNQVTLTPGPWDVTSVSVNFAQNNSGFNAVASTNNYTLDLYRNDGVLDPGGPGTLIASSTVSATSGGDYTIAFPFANVPVPGSFTAVVSMDPSFVGDYTGPAGVIGPYNSTAPPSVGSAVNTIWYTSASSPGGWVSNSTWAITDGATTNFFTMQISAITPPVPEPSSIALALIGLTGLVVYSARRRRGV